MPWLIFIFIALGGRAFADQALDDVLRPLFRSLHQSIEVDPGSRVFDLVFRVVRERRAMIDDLRDLAPLYPEPVCAAILRAIPNLSFRKEPLARLSRAVADFGMERVPLGPTPLPEKIYSEWESRFYDLAPIGADVSEFGLAGELIVATRLKNVKRMNVTVSELFTDRERHEAKFLLHGEDAEFFFGLARARLEIDIIYDSGKSLAEVKFGKPGHGANSLHVGRIRRNIANMEKLQRVFDVLKTKWQIDYIFLGAFPEAESRDDLKRAKLPWRHIPFSFD